MLMLVPTCQLVKQHAAYLKKEMNRPVAEFVGGKPPKPLFPIWVSTHDTFMNMLKSKAEESDSSLREFIRKISLVVFDEVHHVTKKHPYRQIAEVIIKVGGVQVLGMTAAPTHSHDPEKWKLKMNDLVTVLEIKVVEGFTDEEKQQREEAKAKSGGLNKISGIKIGKSIDLFTEVESELMGPCGPQALISEFYEKN